MTLFTDLIFIKQISLINIFKLIPALSPSLLRKPWRRSISRSDSWLQTDLLWVLSKLTRNKSGLSVGTVPR